MQVTRLPRHVRKLGPAHYAAIHSKAEEIREKQKYKYATAWGNMVEGKLYADMKVKEAWENAGFFTRLLNFFRVRLALMKMKGELNQWAIGYSLSVIA